MPSALETLVKILKLEREQGYKNSAVIGGLAAFSNTWTPQAHAQARKPEHHMLVDELNDLMRHYEDISSRDERHTSVSYMLDRITGRLPAPPEYASRVYEMAAPPQEQPVDADVSPETVSPPQQQQHRSDQRADRTKPRKPQPQKQERQRESDRKSDEDGGVGRGDDFSRLDMEFRGGANTPVRLDIPAPPRLARPPRQPRPERSDEAAADIMRGLQAPVEVVKGVGPKMGNMLNRLGTETIQDLLFFLPRRYDDYMQMSYISRLRPGMNATVIGTVRHTEIRIGRGGRKDFFMVVDDGTASMGVTFFGQFYINRHIRDGQQLVLHGTTGIFGNRIQMTNPEWEYVDVEDLKSVGIVPIYPLTEGLTGRTLRRLMKRTVEYWAEHIPDYIPEATLERADLADLGWTVKNLHFPESWDHLEHARRRYIFDQLLLVQLAILGNRRQWQSVPSYPIHISDDDLATFISAVFPYELTGAQRLAIEDIRRDISKDIPMNRLLQGDVGSGKTAVATTAMWMAFANGKQSALMAPTGILAEQHFRGISRMLENSPGERKPVVALLTGSISTSERDAVYAGLAEGTIDMVIGTHAVIQQGVQFRDLALAIIDEQHRFGVEQRGALRGKGTNPHLLVMTATPIPRTLALTIHADLDLSTINEMPPGRLPVRTRVIEPVARERAYHFIEDQIEQGRQAFIVYPLVEASETVEADNAVEAFEKLKKVFYHHKVGLLHGRMKASEKDEIMAAFRDQQFDVLVTTSVAEVGVDIPNASVILIESANRFGLAQLHQFRGRVGRAGHPSYCFLMSDTSIDEAHRNLQRLKREGKGVFELIKEMPDDASVRLLALEETNDGFKLAELDWVLRGPGDLIGTRQSGQTTFQLMENMSPELVELAQREARTIYEEDPELTQQQHRLLAQRVHMRRDERSDLS
jgi:ATP-dependent DNA helicase RecG